MLQEVKGDEFTLNDLTGTARVLTANVPSGCSAPSAGEFSVLTTSVTEITFFLLLFSEKFVFDDSFDIFLCYYVGLYVPLHKYFVLILYG